MFSFRNFLALTLVLSFLGCDSTELKERQALELNSAQLQIVESDNSFGLDLLKKLQESQPNDNLFISPLSISYALGMTLNGAQGSTQSEMIEMLGKENLSIPEINESYRDLMAALETLDPEVAMNIANSIWYRDDFSVLESFKEVNKEYFSAEVEALNFSAPDAKDIINSWVEEKTEGKIEEIVEEIRPDNVMFLINAIYFKGGWSLPFDTELTYSSIFKNVDGTESSIDMMYQMSEIKYAEFDNYDAVEMSYGDEHFSMVIMLPTGTSTVNQILENLDPSSLESTYNALQEEKIFFYLPRFELEYKKKLKDILIDLGMVEAFSDLADLGGINAETNLMVNQVVHKTFVEVNEEGTEAAAVTVVDIVETSLPGYPVFQVDKPFLFLIKDNVANTMIFAGKVTNL